MKHQDRIFQYRINKNGCECFRTSIRREYIDKLVELTEKHPNTKYTVQMRYVPTNRVGAPLLLPNGEPQWSTWC